MDPSKDTSRKPFLLPIEDVFAIKGRGTIVIGKVARGIVQKGQAVDLVGLRHAIQKTRVIAIEQFHKELEEAKAGDNVGLLLQDIDRKDVERGMVLAEADSMKAYRRFKAEITLLRKEEGGRHKGFLSGYRPQFIIRSLIVSGMFTLPDAIEIVLPGDTAILDIELMAPAALEPGSKFSIHEGDLKVGTGRVLQFRD